MPKRHHKNSPNNALILSCVFREKDGDSSSQVEQASKQQPSKQQPRSGMSAMPLLSERHAHPRDQRVRFIDDVGQHEYVIDDEHGRPKDGNRGPGHTYVSVTTFCHKGFGEFDGEKMAKLVFANLHPRSYYWGIRGPEELTRSWSEWDPIKKRQVKKETGIWPYVRDAGTIMHEMAEDHENGQWSLATLDEQEALGLNDFAKRFQDHFRAFTDEFPHLAHFYNRRWTRAQLDAGATSLLPPELEHFLRFKHDHPHLVPYRTEWFVFDEALRLVGAIDMLYWDTRLQQYCIYDWKRSRALRDHHYDGATGTAWQNGHMEDCNVQHYRLQLCTYKLILERNYGIQIAELWLVRCHPDADNYQTLQVHWDEALMANMAAARAREVAGLPEAPYQSGDGEGYSP